MPNGFNTSAHFINDGTATISNGFNENGGGVIQNGGSLTINGSTNLNGSVLNTGSLDFTGSVNLNGGSLLGNACVMRIRNGLNNGSQILNGGWLTFDPATTWQNNGTFLQGIVGMTTGANMTNSGSVTGFGEFSFTGNTVTQGTFSGSSAAQPIIFDDTSPTGGQIFDTQNGIVTNVVAAPVTRTGLDDLPFGCGHVPPSTADVSVVQVGPAVVAPAGPSPTRSPRSTGGRSPRAAWWSRRPCRRRSAGSRRMAAASSAAARSRGPSEPWRSARPGSSR